MMLRSHSPNASLRSACPLIFKAFFPALLLTFSLAPPADAQLRERLRQAGERVADRVQERAEARIDSTRERAEARLDSTLVRAEARLDSTAERAEARIDSTMERAETRLDQALDYAEGQVDDTIQGLDAVLQSAEDAVENTIRCVVEDAQCVERAREEEKQIVFTDSEGNELSREQPVAPAGPEANVVVFDAGDVLVPKIDNVQIHVAPHADASVVGRVTRTDEFVFLGDEQDGFVMVHGATLSGWVRKVLFDRR